MYSVTVTSVSGNKWEFSGLQLKNQSLEKDGLRLTIKEDNKCFAVTADCACEEIFQISHRYTTPLRNFNTVIIPDGGREYPGLMQPINFWSFCKDSVVSNIRTPLFIFCGQNGNASFVFGLIGREYERTFRCVEPYNSRALLAYTRKLTTEIVCRIPNEYREKSFTEYIYVKDEKEDCENSFIEQIADYYAVKTEKEGTKYPYVKKGMYPLWCSWTDWFSDNVTEDVILDNVKSGTPLGIKNYIIDDGWFGPGLDNPYEVKLNIGDWEPDKKKINNLSELSKKIHNAGANGIIWCAPHAVGVEAKCRQERLPYLMKDKNGNLVETGNKFNVLCLRNPKAREIMADICADLIVKYKTDGAKYDLYNCIPNIECCSCEHEHDTDSMVIGLEKTMKGIWERVKSVKEDYIVELKQNYGGSVLSQYGTMTRAGDTPYCPDGNFMRTAYVQAYMPYAINDYQTVSNSDTPLSNSRVIIKMISVGIPTYSMDITLLSEENKSVIKFLNNWYIDNIVEKENYKRHAITGGLDTWVINGDTENLYFLVNTAQNLTVDKKDFQLLNGCYNDYVIVKCAEKCEYQLLYYDIFGNLIKTEKTDLSKGITVDKNISLIKGKRFKQNV